MRVDFNVPLDEGGYITDDSRIVAAIPSIQYVLDQGGSVVLVSHLGRPNGQVDPRFSLREVAEHLSELLDEPVLFASDCISDEALSLSKGLGSGQILMLENLRFHKAEEEPQSDPQFAKQLAKLGDIFVEEAFGTVHRAHASTVDVPKEFKQAACGFLVEQEIAYLDKALNDPKRPFYALIGGAKVSTKLGVLNSLSEKVDGLFLGGGMVYTFMRAMGLNIGNSIFEAGMVEEAKRLIKKCKDRGVTLHLPVDIVVADSVSPSAAIKTVLLTEGIESPFQGVDIGPKTVENYKAALNGAKTVLWNGPFGVFEVPPFDKGTNQIAKVLGDLKATVIVGGGDSVAAVKKCGLEEKMSHLSTGGGATLEYLEKGTLPGIDVLTEVPLETKERMV